MATECDEAKCISYASYFQRTTLPTHGSSDMQEPPNNPVATYIFAFLALLPSALDTGIQWYKVQGRSGKYLLTRVLPLAIILLVDIGLVVFIEVYRSRQRTDWLPALWVLLELSTLLNLSVAAVIYRRTCNSLDKNSSLQKSARRLLYVFMAIVLIIDVLAFSFVVRGYRLHIAVILQASGSFVAHLFVSTLPVWFLGRARLLQPRAFTRKSWGILGCSCATLAAAAMSLALLDLPGVYQKLLGQSILTFVSGIPLAALQSYKLVYKSKGHTSPEGPFVPIPWSRRISGHSSGTSFALSESGRSNGASFALSEIGYPNATSSTSSDNGHLVDDSHLKGNSLVLPNVKLYTLAQLSELGDHDCNIVETVKGWGPNKVLDLLELLDGSFELVVLKSSFQGLESQLLQMYPGCHLKRYDPFAWDEEDTIASQYIRIAAFRERVEEVKQQGLLTKVFYSELWDADKERISPLIRKHFPCI